MPQNGPKMVPKWPQYSENNPKSASKCPRNGPQIVFKMPQYSENNPKIAPKCTKMVPKLFQHLFNKMHLVKHKNMNPSILLSEFRNLSGGRFAFPQPPSCWMAPQPDGKKRPKINRNLRHKRFWCAFVWYRFQRLCGHISSLTMHGLSVGYFFLN